MSVSPNWDNVRKKLARLCDLCHSRRREQLSFSLADAGHVHRALRLSLNMLAKPNKTVIEGTVRAIAPGSEGHEIEIEVHRNLSRGRSDDFIQPAQGQSLHLFAAQTPDVAIGDRVRVQARLLAGPFGERTVLEQLDPLSDEA